MTRMLLASSVLGLLAVALAAPGAQAAATLTIEALEGEACPSGGGLCFNTTNMTVAGGQEVTVTLVNKGTASHSWCVKGLPEGERCAPREAEAQATAGIDGGKQAQVTFTAPAAGGTFGYVCKIPGHQFTMKGNLTVTPGQASPTPSPSPSPTPSPSPSPPPAKGSPSVGLVAIVIGVGLLAIALRRN